MTIGTFFIHQDRRLLLVPIALLNLVPVLISYFSHPPDLLALSLFLLGLVAVVSLFVFWLSKQSSMWANLTGVVIGSAVTIWYIALFDSSFSNAYLASVILVQVIFLYYGPRFGISVLSILVLADIYHMISDPTASLASNLYVVIVEATVGLMAWIFVAAANEMRDTALEAKEEAQQLAAQAVVAQQEALVSRQEALNAKEEAQHLASEVTRLNRILLNSQDTERRRLARDIHDGPLQSLGVALLAMERARRRLDSGQSAMAGQELALLGDIAREAISNLRNTVDVLRNTLLDSGIEPALKNLARKTQESTDLQVVATINLNPEQEQALPESLVNCIYQLSVEGLNNIRLHADAHNATIDLVGKEGRIELLIKDDGRGFDYQAFASHLTDQARGHVGLYSMRERTTENGGTMTIESAPGQGTTLSFTFPTHLPISADD